VRELLGEGERAQRSRWSASVTGTPSQRRAGGWIPSPRPRSRAGPGGATARVSRAAGHRPRTRGSSFLMGSLVGPRLGREGADFRCTAIPATQRALGERLDPARAAPLGRGAFELYCDGHRSSPNGLSTRLGGRRMSRRATLRGATTRSGGRLRSCRVSRPMSGCWPRLAAGFRTAPAWALGFEAHA